MHLLYVTFGQNERHHLQACFSVYSFLARKASFSSINIVTDRPQFYKSIEKHVNIRPVSETTLHEWKGPFAYFWRIKIKAIEWLCRQRPNEPVLYLDSDTFLYGDFHEAFRIIKTGKAAMHINEGPLSDLATKTARKMYSQLSRLKIDGVDNPGHFNMWNAGTILIPNTKQGADIQYALQLCDQMTAKNITPYFIEQYCLSITMHLSYGLEPTSGFIAHYWSNRDGWNSVISTYFHQIYLQALSEDASLQLFNQLALRSVPERKKIRKANVRLKKMIDKLFPDKNLSYLGEAAADNKQSLPSKSAR